MASNRPQPPSQVPSWLQPVLDAAKGLPPPFRFVIVLLALVVLIVLAQVPVAANLAPLFYLLAVGGFVAWAWGEWLLYRSRPPQGESLPGTDALPPESRSEETPVRVGRVATQRPDALRERYLTLMPAEWRTLRLVGIDPEASDAAARRPMTLEQVYVDLDTRTPRPKEERRGKEPEEFAGLRDEPPLSALEVVCRAPEGRMVLLGLPGSGKSTFARHLALRLARACRDPAAFDFETYLPGWDRRVLLPVFVPLGRLAQTLPPDASQGTAAMVETFIRDDVDQRADLRAYGPHLLRELKAQGGLVLFDGLDEVPAGSRRLIKTAVTNFAALYDRCRVVVTCRTHSYHADPGWQLDWPAVHELAPFSQEKIGQFTDAWYKTLSDIEPARAGDYARKAGKLKMALSPADRRQLAELAQTPLLLTVMAVVHTDKDELPDSRVEVYKECVDILLLKWHAERTPGAGARSLLNELKEFGVRRASLYWALWEMAYEAHRAGDRQTFGGDAARAIVTEGTMRKAMHRYLGDDGLRAFIDYCQSANGLLLAQGLVRPPEAPPDAPPVPIYTFPHLTFEEYLAARHLQRLKNFTGRAAGLAGDPAWREVILFLGEYLCFDEAGDIDHAQALLDKLCPGRAPGGDDDWRRVWLAGELLPAVRSEAPAGDLRTELDRRIVARLAQLLDSPQALANAPLDR
ncbi:MAG: NACHT domain-containing protein, partial [Anaerolineae bacterium]